MPHPSTATVLPCPAQAASCAAVSIPRAPPETTCTPACDRASPKPRAMREAVFAGVARAHHRSARRRGRELSAHIEERRRVGKVPERRWKRRLAQQHDAGAHPSSGVQRPRAQLAQIRICGKVVARPGAQPQLAGLLQKARAPAGHGLFERAELAGDAKERRGAHAGHRRERAGREHRGGCPLLPGIASLRLRPHRVRRNPGLFHRLPRMTSVAAASSASGVHLHRVAGLQLAHAVHHHRGAQVLARVHHQKEPDVLRGVCTPMARMPPAPAV